MLLNHWKPGAVLALFLISMHAFAVDPPAVAVDYKRSAGLLLIRHGAGAGTARLAAHACRCSRYNAARDWVADAVSSGRLRWPFSHEESQFNYGCSAPRLRAV